VKRKVILRTARLAVCTWVPGDLDDLNRLHSDPAVMAFIGGRLETRDGTAARLQKYLDEQAARGWTKWRVETTSGQMIGRGGFGDFGDDRELGYTLDPSVWGQGLATELATALVHWHRTNPARRSCGAPEPMRLWAYADVRNIASVRVLTKSGLSFVEIRQHDARPYAFFMLDDDQAARRAGDAQGEADATGMRVQPAGPDRGESGEIQRGDPPRNLSGTVPASTAQLGTYPDAPSAGFEPGLDR
jgi:RimJ/RimL family protein N-acetyltransferase